LVFPPAVEALQERYGSRRQYAKLAGSASAPARLGPQESEFIGERDTFYMGTLGSTGWPYVQHRGGPKGFLKVIDERTIAFADFRGNKQYITTGNLMTDNRVAIILVDYPRQLRLKILGRAEIFEGEQAREWIEKVRDPELRSIDIWRVQDGKFVEHWDELNLLEVFQQMGAAAVRKPDGQ
jgi:predicted pyridoxine 5'-phosphate oxidase superfamily flavin-nucleotide-binding protein